MIYMLKYIQESLREESVSFGVPPKEVPKKANLPFFLSFFPFSIKLTLSTGFSRRGVAHQNE
jgi:hypothetical protein